MGDRKDMQLQPWRVISLDSHTQTLLIDFVVKEKEEEFKEAEDESNCHLRLQVAFKTIHINVNAKSEKIKLRMPLKKALEWQTIAVYPRHHIAF